MSERGSYTLMPNTSHIVSTSNVVHSKSTSQPYDEVKQSQEEEEENNATGSINDRFEQSECYTDFSEDLPAVESSQRKDEPGRKPLDGSMKRELCGEVIMNVSLEQDISKSRINEETKSGMDVSENGPGQVRTQTDERGQERYEPYEDNFIRGYTGENMMTFADKQSDDISLPSAVRGLRVDQMTPKRPKYKLKTTSSVSNMAKKGKNDLDTAKNAKILSSASQKSVTLGQRNRRISQSRQIQEDDYSKTESSPQPQILRHTEPKQSDDDLERQIQSNANMKEQVLLLIEQMERHLARAKKQHQENKEMKKQQILRPMPTVSLSRLNRQVALKKEIAEMWTQIEKGHNWSGANDIEAEIKMKKEKLKNLKFHNNIISRAAKRDERQINRTEGGSQDQKVGLYQIRTHVSEAKAKIKQEQEESKKVKKEVLNNHTQIIKLDKETKRVARIITNHKQELRQQKEKLDDGQLAERVDELKMQVKNMYQHKKLEENEHFKSIKEYESVIFQDHNQIRMAKLKLREKDHEVRLTEMKIRELQTMLPKLALAKGPLAIEYAPSTPAELAKNEPVIREEPKMKKQANVNSRHRLLKPPKSTNNNINTYNNFSTIQEPEAPAEPKIKFRIASLKGRHQNLEVESSTSQLAHEHMQRRKGRSSATTLSQVERPHTLSQHAKSQMSMNRYSQTGKNGHMGHPTDIQAIAPNTQYIYDIGQRNSGGANQYTEYSSNMQYNIQSAAILPPNNNRQSQQSRMMQNRHKSMNNEIFGKSKTTQGIVSDTAVHQNLVNQNQIAPAPIKLVASPKPEKSTSPLTAGTMPTNNQTNKTLDVSNIKDEQQSEILLPEVKVQAPPYRFQSTPSKINSKTSEQADLMPLKSRTYQQKLLHGPKHEYGQKPISQKEPKQTRKSDRSQTEVNEVLDAIRNTTSQIDQILAKK